MLELKVKVVNINLLENHPILAECRPIYEYSWLIQAIKRGIADGLSCDDAIICGIKAAKEDGILIEFLKDHGTEVLEFGLAKGEAIGKEGGKAERISC